MLGKMGLRPFTIYEIKELTHGEADSSKIMSYKMKPKEGQNFNFVPGMFSSLFLSPEDKLFRSYSIASSPMDDHMEFMIELINGKFTGQIADLNEGDEIYVSEPRGAFLYDSNDVRNAMFLAAGIGIAPFFSMLRYIKHKGIRKDICLFYSIKHKDDIVNRDEIEEYRQNGLKTVFTVTRDPQDQAWDGERGRINMKMVADHVPDFVSRTVYLCGGIKFVKDIVTELKERGVKDDEIKRDIWGE